MLPPEKKTPVQMAGYLEKKSKTRVVCRWKKLWFVMEGRLLLYYKSQLEYLSLSPCRGTVNMGLAASVKPGTGQEIIITTRSHTVSLKALNKADHEIWLQALMNAMYLPNSSHNMCYKPLHHFRYNVNPVDIKKQCTLPSIPYKTCDISNEKFIDGSVKLRKTSKTALSETSIPGKFKPVQDSTLVKSFRRSISVNDEFNSYADNIYESLKTVEKIEPKKVAQMKILNKRVMRSDSDCLLMSPREEMRRRFEYNHSFKLTRNRRQYSYEDIRPWTSNGFDPGNKFQSDSDISSAYSKKDYQNLRELIREKTNRPIPLPENPKTRTISLFRRFSPLRTSSRLVKQRNSTKKRSLSFLKKIWCRSESTKWKPEKEEEHMRQIRCDSPMSILNEITAMDLSSIDYEPRPEPPPDYDQIQEEQERCRPELPPRLKRGKNRPCSPWHEPEEPSKQEDEESNWSVEDDEKLTSKQENDDNDLLSQDTDPGLIRLFLEQPVEQKKDTLNEMLDLLCDLNSKNLTSFALYQNTQQLYEASKLKRKKRLNNEEDPDYDVPRPHYSLLSSLKREYLGVDPMQATHFFSGHFDDSLDVTVRGLREEMAPDSLEYDPWSSSVSELSQPVYLADLVEDSLNTVYRRQPFLHLHS